MADETEEMMDAAEEIATAAEAEGLTNTETFLVHRIVEIGDAGEVESLPRIAI